MIWSFDIQYIILINKYKKALFIVILKIWSIIHAVIIEWTFYKLTGRKKKVAIFNHKSGTNAEAWFFLSTRGWTQRNVVNSASQSKTIHYGDGIDSMVQTFWEDLDRSQDRKILTGLLDWWVGFPTWFDGDAARRLRAHRVLGLPRLMTWTKRWVCQHNSESLTV